MIENIAEIKQKADIVEVLSTFLPLRKSGANYTCNCPFHEEKSPSFIISPAKQIYHCFGCNVGGDVFKFIQEFKHTSFEEAVVEVANLCNLQVKHIKGSFNRQNYLEVLNKANGIFLEEIKHKQEVKKYLFNRGLCEEDLVLFDIGYIPSDFPKAFSLQELKLLEELGLCYKGNNGYYAPLNQRISFALRDFTHKAVGFSGRTHPYFNFKNTAKYINSKESRLFKKSQLLYGLSLAKASIGKTKECYVVEGFMDCIALHKMGFKNAVATCGTAFNTQHLSQIIKINEDVKIFLCFDEDEAGKKAKLRASEMLYQQGLINCDVLLLKNACKDIGEVLQKGEKLEFDSVNVLDFFFSETLQQQHTAKAKDKFIEKINLDLEKNNNFFQKKEIIESLKRLGIPYQTQKKIKAQPATMQNLFLSLLKSCLLDENTLNLCINYLEPVEFAQFSGDFESLIAGKTTHNLEKVCLDESISTIDFSNVRFAIFELKTRFIKFQLQQAKTRGDFEKMVLLNAQLAKISHIKP